MTGIGGRGRDEIYEFAKLLIKYQDRVMFGKDTGRVQEYPTYFRILATNDDYFDQDRKYHGMWKAYGLDMPEEVLRKIYYHLNYAHERPRRTVDLTIPHISVRVQPCDY